MKITAMTTVNITQTVLSRAVHNFIEDCDYNADAIKRYYLEYVLSAAMPDETEDEVLDFIKRKMSLEDKKNILFGFVTELKEQFNRDIENALEKEDC